TNRTYIMMPQDTNDVEAEYAPSEYDARHRVVASQIYELPFGRSKRWLQSGPVSAVLGNWAVARIWTFQAGFPGTIYDGPDPCSRAGNWPPSCRPNLVGDPNDGPKTAAQWFNTAAFVRAPVGQSGSAPRNAVRGPGMANTDLTFTKRVAVGATRSL